MASVLNKDPFTYAEDRQRFIQDLHRFHASRGTPFDRIPQIGGREVDLYRLYRRVIDLGGWQKLNNEQLWEDILEEFRLPLYCVNGTQALKHVYFRYLHIYEKVHFLGVDPDQAEESAEDGPARKKVCLPIESVPLAYNYAQHKVPDTIRAANHLETNLAHFGDYDKIEMALRSGLPNEVDFAVNVCLLLSNEGRHVLKLRKSLHLLPLLLANIGVFEDGTATLEDVMLHSWRTTSKRDFLRFWHETIKDEKTRELIKTTKGVYKREDPLGHEVLNLGRNNGVSDPEGQRVTQLAVLIRNLSFEEVNQEMLASSALVFRFLMLCVHNVYGSLRQLALDTLGNLAPQLVLGPMEKSATTQPVLNLIKKLLVEDDKFAIVRALEMLSKLCQLERNESVLNECLEGETYERMVHLLTVHDIQLIVHTLEALYQLSELGDTTTNMIADVKNAVDLLVNLITVEAQSYGPNSLIGIKVVEYVPPPELAGDSDLPSNTVHHSHSIQSVAPSHPYNYPAQSTPALTHQSSAEQQKSDLEATASNWLQGTFEVKKGSCVTQADLFTDYQQFCRKFSVPDTLTVADFAAVVKTAFPQVEVASVEKSDGEKDFVIKGMSKRAIPRPFSIVAGSDKVSKPCSVSSPRGPPLPPPPSTANWSQQLGVNTSNMSPYTMPAPSPPIHTPTLRKRLMEPPRMALHQQLVPPTGTTALGAPPTSTKPVISSTGKPQQPSTPKAPDKAGPKKRQLVPAPPPPGPGPGTTAASPRPPGVVAARPVLMANVVSQRPVLQHHLQVAGAPQPAASIMQPIATNQVMIQPPSATMSTSTTNPAQACSSVPIALPSSTTVSSTTSSPLSSPGQQFPLIHQALQGDGLPPLSLSSRPPLSQADQNDTNLIKSLLAKKVCQNMVRQSHSPTPQDGLTDYGDMQQEAMDQTEQQQAQQQSLVQQQQHESQQNQQLMQQAQFTQHQQQAPALPSSQPAQQVLQIQQGHAQLMVQQQHQQMAPPQLPQPHQLTQQVQFQLQQKLPHQTLQLQPQQLLLQTRPQQLILQQQVPGQPGQQQLVIQSQPTLQQILHQPIQQIHVQPQPQPLQIQAQSQPLQIQAHSQPLQIQAHCQPLQIQTQSQPLQIQAQPQTLQVQAQSQPLRIQAQTQPLQIQGQPQQPQQTMVQTFQIQLPVYGLPQISTVNTFCTTNLVHTPVGTATVSTASRLTLPQPSSGGPYRTIIPNPNTGTTPTPPSHKPFTFMPGPFSSKALAIKTKKSNSRPSSPKVTIKPNQGQGPRSESPLTAVEGEVQQHSVDNKDEILRSALHGALTAASSNLQTMLAGAQTNRDSALSANMEQKSVTVNPLLSAGGTVVYNSARLPFSSCLSLPQSSPVPLTHSSTHLPVIHASSMPLTQAILAHNTHGTSVGGNVPSHLVQQSQAQSGFAHSPMEVGSSQPQVSMGNGHYNSSSSGVVVSQNRECNGVAGYLIQTQANGVLGSPDSMSSDMPPSPMGEGVRKAANSEQHLPNGLAEGSINSLKECARSKDLLNNMVEKTVKMNGVVHHMENGDVKVESMNVTQEWRVPRPGEKVRTEDAESKMRLVQYNGSADVGGNPVKEELGAETPGSWKEPGVTAPISHRDREQVFVKQTSMEEVSMDSVDVQVSVATGRMLLNGGKACEVGRPLFSPDSSRDSDMSSDSFASSITDSVGSDKHSASFLKPATTMPFSHSSTMPSSSLDDCTTILAGTVPTAELMANKKNKKRAKSKAGESPAMKAVVGKADKQPAKSKKRKGSNASNPAADATSPGAPGMPVLEYMCEWAGCKRCFDSARLVFIHVTKTHIPPAPESLCFWEGCEPLQRKRWSLVTHIQDHHCSEMAQRQACHRRFQQAQAQAAGGGAQSAPNLPPAPALVYPPDAALQAIKRFQIRPPFLEFSEQREGPVTKHIRLTAALILRNLSRYSSHGRSLIKRCERQLSYVTMSAVESSTALSNCLYEILHDT